ncbi:hypothetical protein ACFLSW_01395 [Candidatus Bipolaricaulota bacterium]
MANFTLCSKLLETCAKNEEYIHDILAFFLMSVPIKICVDSGGRAKKVYADIALAERKMAEWIRKLGKARGKKVYEEVDIAAGTYTVPLLFLEICSSTSGAKTLLCSTKQHYRGTGWKDRIDDLIDKDEAVVHLRKLFPEICGTGSTNVTEFKRISKSTILNRSTVDTKGG